MVRFLLIRENGIYISESVGSEEVRIPKKKVFESLSCGVLSRKYQTMSSKSDLVDLNCEPCPICKKAIPLKMNKNDYKPSISGVCQVVDIHGLTESEQKHVRILYVDERFSVRSISVITTIADRLR